MTQRPLGKGAGIMAAKSCLRAEKWLKPVNRNMIARARRAASLQEESRLTPSAPKPLRMMNEIARTNRDIMRVSFPRGQASAPRSCHNPRWAARFALLHPSTATAVPTGRTYVSCLLASLLHLLRFTGRGRSFITIYSLRPEAALDHPHYPQIGRA